MIHTILSVTVIITLSSMVVAAFCKEINNHTKKENKRLRLAERAFTWISLAGWLLWIIVSFYMTNFV